MVANPIELDTAITDFVRRLLTNIRVEAVVLYGSYVHGDPHHWSDIDVAVIVPLAATFAVGFGIAGRLAGLSAPAAKPRVRARALRRR